MTDNVRVDKWLWAARFFKTRGLASDACEMGRVEVGGVTAKASRVLKIGNMLRVTSEGGVFEVEVLTLSDVRGPAAVAQAMYRETEESRELRAKVAAERKQMLEGGGVTDGRPTKQDRRKINSLRGRVHRF